MKASKPGLAAEPARVLPAESGEVPRKWIIGLGGNRAGTTANPLFRALENLFPVAFCSRADGDWHGLDALILTALHLTEFAEHNHVSAGLPVLAVRAHDPSAPRESRARFHLDMSPSLDACLRGRSFVEREFTPMLPLPAAAGDDVIATREGMPVWLRRRTADADTTLVAWSLPAFGPEDHVFEHFQAGKFLRLLPLLQFLRNLTCQEDWQAPPSPACLLIDDPSLYSTAYGHLDFCRLAAAAWQLDFYASIATVPLDNWWISRRVIELFRTNAPRLSLVLHGNNHTYEELAHPPSNSDHLALLAQALRRWRRLERLPGLEACRVMECPHGALSVTLLEPLARLGYEAVFATAAHLLRHNRNHTFHPSLGAEPALLGRNAAPVIPRIRAEDGWQTEVRLAAFLRQPIVLAVHHWDFAKRSQLVEDFVGIVNSLPGVRWASPAGIARTSYQYRQTGGVLHLKLGSRLVRASIPPSVQHVVVHRPWLCGAPEPEPELLTVRAQGIDVLREVSSADRSGPIPAHGLAELEISSSILAPIDRDSVPAPRLRCWPLMRKLIVEVRDRSRLRLPRLPRTQPALRRATGPLEEE